MNSVTVGPCVERGDAATYLLKSAAAVVTLKSTAINHAGKPPFLPLRQGVHSIG